ncbi:hypothetical protein [Commensalibacter melissae]|uniref:hypothetical protein n=1 Tax=Commensalibacter melissae TaxID=2070537 RepID=UPI0012D87D7F|nr:hypothetical protein [Commensalibacter melissae]MUG08617.1 hypothetical protein [Commensalibacter melissae]
MMEPRNVNSQNQGYDARAIANYFLHLARIVVDSLLICNCKNSPISHMVGALP